MKDFYYQIKVKDEDGYWSYSPVMKGIIQANSTKEARQIVKDDIICRDVKRGDPDILLYVCEVKEDEQYLKDFFKPRICKHCGRTYNQSITGWYSAEYCCENCCKLAHNAYLPVIVQESYITGNLDNLDWTKCNPVIYRIYNTENKKNYIGQTIRAFTLRWWEHFKMWIKLQPEGISSFQFSVLEEFTKQEVRDNPNILNEREQYWINFYDAINNGYNQLNVEKGEK